MVTVGPVVLKVVWLVEVVKFKTLYLVFGPGGHDGTGLLGAELGDGAVQHVDLVEEVHRVDRHPLVQIFSFR